MPVEGYDDDECPVCYQKMILPTKVPACGHTFCFLCIKGLHMGPAKLISLTYSDVDLPGAATRFGENLCPMCRGEISPAIFKRPKAHGVTLDMHDPESPSVQLAVTKPTTSGLHSKRIKSTDSDSGPSTKKTKEKDPDRLHSKRVKSTDSDSGPSTKKTKEKDPDSGSVKEERSDVETGEAEKELDEEPMPDNKERFYWLYKVGNADKISNRGVSKAISI
ncbi:unnamed protein product [Strongylus vulgaris]|uniref:E3 ubiquitin-protein ligase n=1 Tax=Strongylus vulgaris TaxID=40348 RepID=A0A3P7JMT9_STRVU|nr:unnamed protein product [Strongylus vulgaris]